MEVEIETASHQDSSRKWLPIEWDITAEIAQPDTTSSLQKLQRYGEKQCPSGSVSFPYSLHATGRSTPNQPQATSRTVSDSSSNLLQLQFQQNAKKFTELMRRSDQTRSIVRKCRPSAKLANATESPSQEAAVDCSYMLEEEGSSSSQGCRHGQNFFDSDRCRKLERPRKQLYPLLTENCMTPSSSGRKVVHRELR